MIVGVNALKLPQKLSATGLDADPDTIRWHLDHHYDLQFSRHPCRPSGFVEVYDGVRSRDAPRHRSECARGM